MRFLPAVCLAALIPAGATAEGEAVPRGFREVRPIRTMCLPTPELAMILSGAAHERIIMRGATSGGGLFELWANRDGSFTVVLVPVRGMSCVVADGDGLEPGQGGT